MKTGMTNFDVYYIILNNKNLYLENNKKLNKIKELEMS